jgi:hypothetical protein
LELAIVPIINLAEVFKRNRFDIKQANLHVSDAITLASNAMYEANVRRRYIFKEMSKRSGIDALSTIGSYSHLCDWLISLLGLFSIKYPNRSLSSKQSETMLPCFGLKNQVFVILLPSSMTSMFIYKITVTCALASQNIMRLFQLFVLKYLS